MGKEEQRKPEEEIKKPDFQLPEEGEGKEAAKERLEEGIQRGLSSRTREVEEIRKAKREIEEIDIRKSPEQIAIEERIAHLGRAYIVWQGRLLPVENELKKASDKLAEYLANYEKFSFWKKASSLFGVIQIDILKGNIGDLEENCQRKKEHLAEISEEIDFLKKKLEGN